MKLKLIPALILIFGLLIKTSAQDYSGLKEIILQDKTDYPKAEAKVLECSNYILSTPLDDNNLNRLNSIQFIIRWMEGTPDYMFNIDETISKITKSNDFLLGVYLSCMTKFTLENKDKAKDIKEVKYNSIVLLLNYCEVASNKVNLNKELKRMIEAKKEDRLKEYLKL